MPIYEYICRRGHKFEVRRMINKVGLPERCPECKQLSKPTVSKPALITFKEPM